MRTTLTLLVLLGTMPIAQAQINLIENGDFETFLGGTCPPANVHTEGRTPAGAEWAANGTPDHLCSYTGGTYGQETPHLFRADLAHGGKGYIFLQGHNPPQSSESYSYTFPWGLGAGVSYTFSFWGKDPVNFEGGTFLLKGASGTTYASQNLHNVNAWTNYSFTFVPTVNEAYMLLTANGGTAAIALDDVMLGMTGPLPLRLTSFSAGVQGKYVAVQWQMAEDDDVATYTVERSLDGSAYQAIGTLPPTPDNGSKDYRFLDSTAPAGVELYYRVKLLEKSGSWHFTWTVPVRTAAAVSHELIVSPNPTNGDIQVMGLKGSGEIRILSADGVLRMARTTTDPYMKIETADLPSGVYFMHYISNTHVDTRTFVKQ